jgi:Cu(I)/Ag(I) efflux system periplasmic protein CusF
MPAINKGNLMKTLSNLMFAVLATVAINLSAYANEAHHAPTATQTADAASAMTEGEIKKVNKETGKLTIKHGELKNLGMPPMTMVFLVKEPSMLDQVNTGDKVKFIAEKVDGKLTVMQLQPAN